VDGIHDLGGRQGFGRVEAEADEPPFHEPWEGRVHGMSETIHVGPGFRHAIERMEPAAYLTTSYYEHWMESIETRGIEHGFFTREDLAAAAARIEAGEPVPQRSDPEAAREARAMLRPRPKSTYSAPAPRHGVGDTVTVVRVLPAGHTRCPGYLRGAQGVVERVHAPMPLLDVYESQNGLVRPEAWYTVAFSAGALWEVERPGHTILVDLWESHLEAT
jgi:nitrile hydratase subunit beta